MKHLLFAIAFLSLTACGGKSGGGAAAPVAHVPDTTPHTYISQISDVFSGGDGLLNAIDYHQVCDFGLPGLRDNQGTEYVQDPGSMLAGISCGNVSNYTVTFTNNSTDELAVIIQVDGVVVTPDINGATHVLQPGETYNFQRGF